MSKKQAHHGGSWKVAYADFTTAMMALFLCLWLTSQDEKIKDAVERAFRNPFSSITKGSIGILPEREDASDVNKKEDRVTPTTAVEMEMMRRLSDDLAKLLKLQDENQSNVKIELTREGLLVSVFDRSQKPIFNSGTDVFTEYGAWVFSTLAWEIARFSTFRIELEGHTEASAPTGIEAHSQWELSSERANAARRKLVQSGVGDSQICKVSGYAGTVPMPGYSPTAEVNRRVTVILKLKETVNALPGSASPTAP